MLYTFSKSQYDQQQLAQLFSNVIEQDAILLWQDGVLLPVKYPTLFQPEQSYFLLENDIIARDLHYFFSENNTSFSIISLRDLVKLTEQYSPQVSL
ncbi:sulfur transfer complex subunit TusB [Gallibacterium salpingitidis]|uniref:DsrH/TusB family sulfur relay protein n=1 Tax=Gallibacterium salpingitidis TaxID=505341 RepID=UPI000804A779|nr:DsrH/TusB family sulfur metabolism protein [Gallibacterium salpingitidis]OBX09843.1 sulfur transfer complex subunit TusB [Gallibacterium salpingitidis]